MQSVTERVSAGDLLRRLSSWLTDMHTVGHSGGFFDVVTVNVFSSVNKMMLTSISEQLY